MDLVKMRNMLEKYPHMISMSIEKDDPRIVTSYEFMYQPAGAHDCMYFEYIIISNSVTKKVTILKRYYTFVSLGFFLFESNIQIEKTSDKIICSRKVDPELDEKSKENFIKKFCLGNKYEVMDIEEYNALDQEKMMLDQIKKYLKIFLLIKFVDHCPDEIMDNRSYSEEFEFEDSGFKIKDFLES